MSGKTGIILGSGLHGFTDELTSQTLLHEDDSSMHRLKIINGFIEDNEVMIFSGRKHYYEGYDMDTVLGNVKLASENELDLLIITNAAGGINPNFKVADLMLITSHLNFINHPLPVTGGKRIYDRSMLNKVKQFAIDNTILLRTGTYCCMTGPTYETGSEIRFLSKAGVDAVGMSTVPETIFASNAGMKTISISCITNILSENSDMITDHEEVVEAGKKAYAKFSALVKMILRNKNLLIN